MTELAPDLAEVEMLCSTARRLFGSDPTLLQAAPLGLLGLLTAEDCGGAGWSPAEGCVAASEAGRALSPLPWADSLLVAATLAHDPDVVEVEVGRLLDAWLWSRALTIAGGSSEVMRNIITKRRLGLPQYIPGRRRS